MFKKSNLLASFSITTLFIAVPALAQDTGDDNVYGYDSIVVTAQRRAQSLQDVPFSVSAFNSDTLAELGVVDITGIAKFTPNVTLQTSRGTNNTLTAFIRGVGQQDPVAGFEGGVGIYIDDIYLNRPQSALVDVFDVERIEVLRGPQGTLYGRNTIGGAIKYITRSLSEEPMFRVKGTYGSYNQTDVVISGSMPLNEALRVGGSLAILRRDGFGENLTLGQDNYNKDILAGRVSAELDLMSNFQVRVAGDYTKDNSNARHGHRIIPSFTQPDLFPVSDEFDSYAGSNFIESEGTDYGISVVGEYTLDDNWTLKSVFAYRENENTTSIDNDGLPVSDIDTPVIYENDQLSEELQVLYSSDKLNGLFGFYYLDANAANTFDVLLDELGKVIGAPGFAVQTFGDVNTKTWSIFGDFTYDFSPSFYVALGGRYTQDKRSAVIQRGRLIGGVSSTFGGSGFLFAQTSDFEGSEKYTDFSPRATIGYKPTGNSNVYFTFAQGFKGGSFDPRGDTTAAPDLNGDGTVSADEVFEFMVFDPEEVNSYELGYKTSLYDGRFSMSLAGFYADYKDVQIPSAIVIEEADGSQTFVGVTDNAAAATLWGIEFEGRANVANDLFSTNDSLNADWSLGYINAKFDEFIDSTGQDVADLRGIQNTPDWTGALRLNYKRPLSLGGSDGDITFNGSVTYRGDTQLFEVATPSIDQKAYALLGASVRWTSDDGSLGLTLAGTNLTDKRYRVAAYNIGVGDNPDGSSFPTLGLDGARSVFYGNPRTVSLTAEYNF